MKKILTVLCTMLICLSLLGCDNDPKYAEKILKEADSYFQSQQYDKAKDLYFQVANDHPKTDSGKQSIEILNNYNEKVEKDKSAIAAKKAAEEKAEAERKEAERKAHEEKIKPPVELSNIIIDTDMIGTPQVAIIMTNTSQKTIDAFKVKIYAYDNYGKQLKEFGSGSDYFSGISQRELVAGATTSGDYYWTLYGFENGRKFKAQLYSVHFTDDTSWEAESGQDVSVSGKM